MNEIRKNTALIVDDEKMVIMALTQILNPEYTVYAVKDGQDALEKAEKFLPDIILLDIVMPDMDGYDVITALKNSDKTKNIPVIFITGLGEVGDEEKGLALGAADYIIKPFSSAIVKQRVKNQIRIMNQTRLIIDKEVVEQSNRNRVEFLLNMSHEMLTPMNAIMGMTQIAKTISNPEKTNDCLNEIGTASRHLLRLIKDLLEMSGNYVEKITPENSVFSFKTMMRSVLEKMNHEIEEKQQEFTYDIDPSIPMLLVGDEKRLAQVITNLLSNAVKYTREHGKIHFSAYIDSEEDAEITLQIEITDDGSGMPEENQNDIFSYFGQAENGAAGRHESIRFGSTRTKRIIEMMNGKIWGDFEQDRGVKIAFTCKVQKR